MAETFCGKSCENCEEKLSERCAGCKKPWGVPANEDCEIAVCCHGKSHESCETCTFLKNCGKVREREDMLYCRRRKKEEEERRSAHLRQTYTERAELMGKWCAVLFWTVILAELASLLGMLGENILTKSLDVIFGAAYGAALFQLAPLTGLYRTAGICAIASAAVVLIMGALPVSGEAAALAVLLLIPGAIVSLIGDYYEFHAHAEMLEGLDDDFAKKWKKLWMWQIRLILLILGVGWIAVITLPEIFIMLTGAAALIIHIAKILYLHRMSKFFRNYESL